MENSVDSYISAQPESVMSMDEFWHANGGNSESFYSPGNQFLGWLTGMTNKYKSLYEAYLTNVKNKNEFIAAQSANAYQKMMDDTKYQRMMRDLEKAGLNPYLLINNNGISASSAPSAAKPSYDTHQLKKSEGSSGDAKKIAGATAALLAVMKIAAMFL